MLVLRAVCAAAAALLLCLSGSLGAPAGDEIKSLPGWDGPLPSRWFAGYIDAGSEGSIHMHEHYVFVEAEDVDPATAPVLLWSNGGPGASSIFGLFIELGPFFLSFDSLSTAAYNRTGIPTLFRNSNNWARTQNLLILNSPPPVGFSYCDPAGPSGGGTSCGPWNDTRTAVHNYEFLKNWYAAFPEYANNDLYLSGESYAGVYIPMLAQRIVEDTATGLPLKGFAIGDPCLGTEVICGSGDNGHSGPLFHIAFMYGHGQMSTKLYNEINKACTYDELVSGHLSPACEAPVNKVASEVGGYYAYDLYDDCPHNGGFMGADWRAQQRRSYWSRALPTSTLRKVREVGGAVNEAPCGGQYALHIWINTTQAREAFHVAKDAFYFSEDNGGGFNYTLTEATLLPFITEMITKQRLRILVYNGDADPGINSFLTQNWTASLDFPVTQDWRPWTLDGKQQVAGYVTRYATNFDFLTIRGAGHMVPLYKSAPALELLTRWIRNEDWQHYSPS